MSWSLGVASSERSSVIQCFGDSMYCDVGVERCIAGPSNERARGEIEACESDQDYFSLRFVEWKVRVQDDNNGLLCSVTTWLFYWLLWLLLYFSRFDSHHLPLHKLVRWTFLTRMWTWKRRYVKVSLRLCLFEIKLSDSFRAARLCTIYLLYKILA